jgi:hypothetical protein
VTPREHSQGADRGAVSAGQPAPVATKAAAIDAAQQRPLTWQNAVKRALVVAVAGVAIYLVLPKLAAVLGSRPRQSTLSPIWFSVALAAELVWFFAHGISLGEPAGSADVDVEEVQQPGLDAGGFGNRGGVAVVGGDQAIQRSARAWKMARPVGRAAIVR